MELIEKKRDPSKPVVFRELSLGELFVFAEDYDKGEREPYLVTSSPEFTGSAIIKVSSGFACVCSGARLVYRVQGILTYSVLK